MSILSDIKFYHYIILFINIIIIAFMYIFIIVKYDSIPDEIPNKYDFNGEVKSYTGKAVLYVFPIVSTFITVLLTVLSIIPNLVWKVLEKYDILNDLKSFITRSWVCYTVSLPLCISVFFSYILICMIYSIKVSLIFILLYALVMVLLNTVIPIVFVIKLIPLLKRDTNA